MAQQESQPRQCSSNLPRSNSNSPALGNNFFHDVGIEDYISTETEEQRQLMKSAQQRVYERGVNAVVEELSYAYNIVDASFLPYLSKAVIEALEKSITISTPMLKEGFSALKSDLASLSTVVHSDTLQTGCSSIDELLGGGFPTDAPAIFEVSGAASAGKTQFVGQVALMCGAPKAVGGLSSFAIYTSTEGVPPVRRLQSLSASLMQRLKLGPSETELDKRLIIESVRTSDHLLNWASFRLPYLLRETGARLVIIDSVAAVYRVEFTDALARSKHFVQLTSAIRNAMTPVSALCICVNQVSQAVDRFTGTLDATVPALGSSWAHLIATRLFLKRTVGIRRIARVLHSSYLPDDGRIANFSVTGEGIVPADD